MVQQHDMAHLHRPHWPGNRPIKSAWTGQGPQQRLSFGGIVQWHDLSHLPPLLTYRLQASAGYSRYLRPVSLVRPVSRHERGPAVRRLGHNCGGAIHNQCYLQQHGEVPRGSGRLLGYATGCRPDPTILQCAYCQASARWPWLHKSDQAGCGAMLTFCSTVCASVS